MPPLMLYELFKRHFPWLVPHVVKYKGDRKTWGITLYLDSNEILQFSQDPDNKKGWILKGVNDDRP